MANADTYIVIWRTGTPADYAWQRSPEAFDTLREAANYALGIQRCGFPALIHTYEQIYRLGMPETYGNHGSWPKPDDHPVHAPIAERIIDAMCEVCDSQERLDDLRRRLNEESDFRDAEIKQRTPNAHRLALFNTRIDSLSSMISNERARLSDAIRRRDDMTALYDELVDLCGAEE